jgi:uncharacterized protein (DUF952 family)
MSELPSVAYKVLAAAEMAAFVAAGLFAGSPVDLADGFIHLSAADQLDETVAKHFAGQTDLVVLAVDLTALGSVVRWEPSRGGALFPHIYATLPIAAVLSRCPLSFGTDGSVLLPQSGRRASLPPK